MKVFLKFLFMLLILFTKSKCSIDGTSYMDRLKFNTYRNNRRDDNPCNPLYWYPRQIPEYCYNFVPNKKPPSPVQSPIPIPVPFPPQPPPFFPFPIPMGPVRNFFPIPSPLLPPLMPHPIPIPLPADANHQPSPLSLHPGLSPSAVANTYPLPVPPISPALPILPYGIPINPTNPMLPVAGLPDFMNPHPMSYLRTSQAGFVPGIPGMVSSDGGINILPFSDVYSDLLEKNKQKQLRKRLQKVLDRYGDIPKKKYRTRRIY